MKQSEILSELDRLYQEAGRPKGKDNGFMTTVEWAAMAGVTVRVMRKMLHAAEDTGRLETHEVHRKALGKAWRSSPAYRLKVQGRERLRKKRKKKTKS